MIVSEVKRLPPQERLLYWIIERELVRVKKERGDPKPWTDDVILQSYRFCNVRRMDDKVSRWLYDNWYKPYRGHHNMLPAVALARHFNLPSALGLIGFPELWDPKWMATRLREYKAKGNKIFNAAYMVRGIGEADKTEMVINRVCCPLVITPPIVDTSSMRRSVEALLPYWGFSSFMAGQVVADLRWAVDGRWSDKHTWAPYGPGSRRGLVRLLGSDKGTMESAIGLMKAGVPASVYRRLEAMDYQNCLCEWDKYERTLWGEGRPKQLYRGM